MKRQNSKASELFHLMFDLAQSTINENIIDVFVATIKEIWPDIIVSYRKTKSDKEVNNIEISASDSNYGYLIIDNSTNFENNDLNLLHKAVAMLAVILKKNEHEKLLADVIMQIQKLAGEKIQVIKEEEEKFRNAFEYSIVGKSITTIDGKMKTNQAFCQLLGYSEDELSLLKWYDITHKDDIESTRKVIGEIISGEKNSARWEKRYIHKTGNVIWVDISKTLQRDDKGNPLYFIISINDITERKRVELALLENEKKLSDAQEMAHLGFWNWDIKTGDVEWSDEVFRIFCLDPDGFTPHIESILALSPWPDDHKRDIELINRAVENHNPGSYEQKFLRPDGSIGYYYSTFQGKFDENDNLLSIIGTVLDITERKQAEESLINSEDRFRSIFENMASGCCFDKVIYKDGVAVDYRIMNVNPAYSRILGFSREEVIGKLASEIYKTDVIPFFDIYARVAETGVPESFESYFAPAGIYLYVTSSRPSPGMFSNVFSDISDRKKSEDTIFQSKKDWEDSFDSITDMITIHDQDYNIIRANKAGMALLKLPAIEKHLKLKCFSFYHGTDNPPAGCPSCDCIKSGVPGVFELFEPHLDRYLEIRAIPRFDSVNQQVGMIHIVRDISERKKAEEVLRKTNDYLESLFNYSNVPIIVWDASLHITRFNKAFEELSGYNTVDVIGKKVNILFPKNKIDSTLELIKNTAIGARLETVEIEILRKNGEIRIVLWNSANILDNSQKEIIATIAQGNDITVRKQAEEALRESEERYIAISEYSNNAVCIVDENARIEWVSPQMTVISGYSAQQILDSESFVSFLAPESIEFVVSNFKKMLLGEPYEHHYEFLFIHSNGEKRLCEKYMMHFYDKHGKIKLIISMTDITERNLAEIELKKSKEKAETSDRLKSAFLANMSHEIRTPLNAIVGFSGLLSNPDLSSVKRSKYAGIIQSRSDDLLYIINDILEISRIESGNEVVTKEQFEVNAIIDELEVDYKLKIRKINKSNLMLFSEKPLSDGQSEIFTDKQLVKRVFSNLIDNAIKFTGSGSIRFGYKSPENNTLTCFVSDTGIGISAENMEVIFEPFRQAEISDKKKLYGGTGLGLSICKGSLDLLDGKIWVESKPEEGAVFYFTLPFGQATEPKTECLFEFERKPGENTFEWAGKKLLIVEDEVTNMEFLNIILQPTRAELVCAVNGQNVRDLYDNLNTFDMVLLDIRLPDANGWDIAMEIKKIRPNLPVIVQTAYAMESDRIRSKEINCNDYISKPINRELLLKKISNFI